MLFGGGWSDGSRAGGVSYWSSLLAAHGIACASVDYRLSGDAPFPAQIHDVKAAIRWLRANTDFLMLDRSELDHPVFTQFFNGTAAEREDLIRLASPLTHVLRGAPPFLIAHGTLDETVPFSQSEQLHRALVDVGTPVEFVPIEGGYHNWNPRPERAPRARYHDFAYLALRFFQTNL